MREQKHPKPLSDEQIKKRKAYRVRYRKANKEKLAAYMKKWHQDNKDRVNKKRRDERDDSERLAERLKYHDNETFRKKECERGRKAYHNKKIKLMLFLAFLGAFFHVGIRGFYPGLACSQDKVSGQNRRLYKRLAA
jgi:hypothetical protein